MSSGPIQVLYDNSLVILVSILTPTVIDSINHYTKEEKKNVIPEKCKQGKRSSRGKKAD